MWNRSSPDAMHDLLITGGTVVNGHGIEAADVAIDGERIAALYPREHAPIAARETLDATGKLVLPGAIDPHVHYELVSEATARSGRRAPTTRSPPRRAVTRP